MLIIKAEISKIYARGKRREAEAIKIITKVWQYNRISANAINKLAEYLSFTVHKKTGNG